MRRAFSQIALLISLGSATACSRAEPAESPAPSSASAGPVREFSWEGPDGQRLSAASTRGRTTLLVFGASYDLATQVAARELDALVRRRKPRINVGLVMLEGGEYSPLVAGFRSALGLEYPVVLADEATLAGEGGFGEVGTMPLYVVLDRSGRECWRGAGVTDPETLSEVLDRAEALGAKGTYGAAR